MSPECKLRDFPSGNILATLCMILSNSQGQSHSLHVRQVTLIYPNSLSLMTGFFLFLSVCALPKPSLGHIPDYLLFPVKWTYWWRLMSKGNPLYFFLCVLFAQNRTCNFQGSFSQLVSLVWTREIFSVFLQLCPYGKSLHLKWKNTISLSCKILFQKLQNIMYVQIWLQVHPYPYSLCSDIGSFYIHKDLLAILIWKLYLAVLRNSVIRSSIQWYWGS